MNAGAKEIVNAGVASFQASPNASSIVKCYITYERLVTVRTNGTALIRLPRYLSVVNNTIRPDMSYVLSTSYVTEGQCSKGYPISLPI